MAYRGRRPPRPAGRRRGPPREREYVEAEELGSREVEIESKKFLIEVKANDQGRFVKILEIQTQGRGRIIFSVEKAVEFQGILSEFVAENERLGPPQDVTESERLKTESFAQGRRRYYVDLRQNQRGRFLKVTMLAGGKTFIAIPGEGLTQFADALSSLLDDFGSVPAGGGAVGGASGQGTPPPQDNLPGTREVRAGGKRFYFDVLANDRGTFIRLSEVLRGGRRTHLNIPHSCWGKIGEVFTAYARDLPAEEEEESTGSASEDN